MEFEASKAWTEAVEMARAKRDLLWPVAGVFLLLPALVTTFLYSDLQTMMIGDPERAIKMLEGKFGTFFAVTLATFAVQMVGYMAAMKLLHNRERPTVGQALSHAVAGLPAIIGVSLLFFVTLFVAMLAVMFAAVGSPAIGMIVGVVLLVGTIYAMVRLSLTMPAIVIEGKRNPIIALVRSWQLTRGNVLQLLLFYIVLVVAYAVITMLIGGLLGVVIGVTVGVGAAGKLIVGLLAGLIGAVVAVLMAAILVATHRQLSGEVAGGISATFE
jgi:hypothetical protein